MPKPQPAVSRHFARYENQRHFFVRPAPGEKWWCPRCRLMTVQYEKFRRNKYEASSEGYFMCVQCTERVYHPKPFWDTVIHCENHATLDRPEYIPSSGKLGSKMLCQDCIHLFIGANNVAIVIPCGDGMFWVGFAQHGHKDAYEFTQEPMYEEQIPLYMAWFGFDHTFASHQAIPALTRYWSSPWKTENSVWRWQFVEDEVKSSVYFIRNDDTGDIKIGFSECVPQRLLALQTATGSRLTLLATEPGGRQRESRLHEYFEAIRKRGEWFQGHDWLQAYLANATGRIPGFRLCVTLEEMIGGPLRGGDAIAQ